MYDDHCIRTDQAAYEVECIQNKTAVLSLHGECLVSEQMVNFNDPSLSPYGEAAGAKQIVVAVIFPFLRPPPLKISLSDSTQR